MIKIIDNEEPLVSVEKMIPGIKISLAGNKKAYLRETVVKMLKSANNSLPKGYSFVLGDAWRSIKEQISIRKGFVKRFEKMHPDWDKKKILDAVDKYAAPHQGKYFSGHLTGAAIDVRLIKNGRRIPMKSKKLTYEENAKSNQSKLPRYLKKNRKIMSDALLKASFTNYPKEFWHWSYGDWQWAKRGGKKEAFYNITGIKED